MKKRAILIVALALLMTGCGTTPLVTANVGAGGEGHGLFLPLATAVAGKAADAHAKFCDALKADWLARAQNVQSLETERDFYARVDVKGVCGKGVGF